MQRLAGIGLEALFPATCCDCGRLFKLDLANRPCPPDASLQAQFKQLMGSYLCTACREQVDLVHSPLCPHCGLPFDSSVGADHLCGPCISNPFRFKAARAVGLYQGTLRSLIHHYKYQGRDNLAGPLGRLLWQGFCAHWASNRIDLVVPVPLHARRLRQRGFNQAYALVRWWPRLAALSGASAGATWVDATVLQRHRFTHPQTGLKKDERKVNLRNAFSVLKPERVRNRRILLVDDVFTTGATVNACARTLLQSGAAEVNVLTLARTVL